MKIEYTGRHIDVTPALKAHVEEHFERIDHLFEGAQSSAHVIIEVERGKHRSEIVVKWRNEVLTATTSVSDMYKSLSQSIAKIEKQALKLKNKITDKHHKAEKLGAIASPQNDVQPEPDQPGIIKTENYSIKPMTPEEAVLQLEQQDNQFLVFRTTADQSVAVIYKRNDRNYGLIHP
ncbi:MAG: ribosome-associated translation inhibitor RaiA [Pyrinomonadaceae bacterium]|nr:ribosome-associated translation inhibitor RaiA [Pyrinomonadaceae bacterium]